MVINCSDYDTTSLATAETSDDMETVSMDTSTFHQVGKNLIKTRNKRTLCELNEDIFILLFFFPKRY